MPRSISPSQRVGDSMPHPVFLVGAISYDVELITACTVYESVIRFGIFEALLNGILWIILQFYGLTIKICDDRNGYSIRYTVDLRCYAIDCLFDNTINSDESSSKFDNYLQLPCL